MSTDWMVSNIEGRRVPVRQSDPSSLDSPGLAIVDSSPSLLVSLLVSILLVSHIATPCNRHICMT